MKLNHIYQGDCLKTIKTLPDESIDCCVTSPPYWGLRDYGHEGQLGLEDSPEEYVQNMVNLFSEIRRVLKTEGSLWLNLGDSYAGNCSRSTQGRAGLGVKREGVYSKKGIGLKDKDLVGIPWRVAFALQAEGWFLRQDIIWHKPNPLPESVKDRCTKSHEYIFLLTKSSKYFFDYEGIREDVAESTRERMSQENLENQVGSNRVPGKTNGNMKAVGDGEKRNKRSVWSVCTKPFKFAHFATFPEELILPCIIAGCPRGGVVLDPFMGAGTTALVAKKNGLNFIGCELNEEYIAIAEKRISQDYLY